MPSSSGQPLQTHFALTTVIGVTNTRKPQRPSCRIPPFPAATVRPHPGQSSKSQPHTPSTPPPRAAPSPSSRLRTLLHPHGGTDFQSRVDSPGSRGLVKQRRRRRDFAWNQHRAAVIAQNRPEQRNRNRPDRAPTSRCRYRIRVTVSESPPLHDAITGLRGLGKGRVGLLTGPGSRRAVQAAGIRRGACTVRGGWRTGGEATAIMALASGSYRAAGSSRLRSSRIPH